MPALHTIDEVAGFLANRLSEGTVISGAVGRPGLDAITELMGLLGDPQTTYPVIQVTGTNGKTSTVRMISSLLQAKGLSVGTYTKPHLDVVNERIERNGQPIDDHDLIEAVNAVAAVEELMTGPRPSYFDVVVAAALWSFSDNPVDVAVIEVGLGGRWDSTNIVTADVAVITMIGLDHVEYLGDDIVGIAGEKAGIIKPTSRVILGETDPELVPVFLAEESTSMWRRGIDFECTENLVAHGGRVLDIRTPAASYEGVFLALHGSHQGDNAACAVAAVEAFFDAPTEPDIVAEGLGATTSPGRVEVVNRRPLIIIDGIKNPDGAQASAATINDEFGEFGRRILVVGLLATRDPDEMLEALEASKASVLIACQPPISRAMDSSEVASAARRMGIEQVEDAGSVVTAVQRALALAEEDDLILITGSLFVVAPAKSALRDLG